MKKKKEVLQHVEPLAYILCYTLRFNHNGKQVDTDHWLVFCEHDEWQRTPEQQAQNRLNELTAEYESNEACELYTWNIAAITQTNEHYTTGTATKYLDIVPEAVPDQWDNVEVEAVTDLGDQIERCKEKDADFWSVYLHRVNAGVQCIADLPTKELAKNLAETIRKAVKNYKGNGLF